MYGRQHGVKFKYYEAKLNGDTVGLAKDFDGVCAFVNDTVDASVIDSLNAMVYSQRPSASDSVQLGMGADVTLYLTVDPLKVPSREIKK